MKQLKTSIGSLGPGLLEPVYEVILARELSDHGLKVERILLVHKKQTQTYLRLTTGLKLGTLLNFGEAVLKANAGPRRNSV